MLFDIFFTIIGYIVRVIFDILGAIFAAFDLAVLPGDWGQSIGAVFGNIWLLNSFLPVDHLFTALGLALSWKIALFLYDGFLYVFTLVNLVKRTFFSVGG